MRRSYPGAAHRRPSTLGRLASGAGLGLLVAVALVATDPDGPATPDAPAPVAAAPAVITPSPVTTPPVEPTPAATSPIAGAAATEEVPPVRPERAGSPPRDRTARPAPVRTRTTLTRSEPTRVRIPAIGVDSALVDLGLLDDGRMEVPPGAFPAGWFTGAPTPGELGPAVLAGHVDYGGVAGVFARLRELRPGDAVGIARDDGTTVTFRVTRVEQHPKDAFPTAAVYGDIDHAGLRLITCGGSFDRDAHSYEDNIVVFAELDVEARRDGPA